MTGEEIRELSKGKYARQRRMILENHAPKLLDKLTESGRLEKHLASIQTTASDFVDLYVDRCKKSAEYKEAEKEDCFKAMRLLNMTILEAEDAAFREWIAVIPDYDEDDEDYDIDEENCEEEDEE